MSRASRWLTRCKPGLFGACLAAGFGLAAWWLIAGLSNLSYDLLFLLRPRQPVSGFSIVQMDETSAEALEQPVLASWDRKIHADLIKKLVASRARVIVFDVLFDKVGTNAQLLLDAVEFARGAGVPVVFAAKPNPEGAGLTSVLRPFPALEKRAAWGLAVGETSSDRIVRRHVEFESAAWPSLAWTVSSNALGEAQTLATNQTRWINYYGPPGTFLGHSYHRVLKPEFGMGVFSDQVVLIGGGFSDVAYLGGKETDSWPTPWSLLGKGKAAGAEVSATACLNYMRRDWLRRSSPWMEAILIAAGGLICGFGLALSSWRWAGWLALLAVGLIAGASVYFMQQQQVWFAWVPIAGVEIPVALAWSFRAHLDSLRRKNESLQRQLVSLGARPEELSAGEEARPDPTAGPQISTPVFRTSGPFLAPMTPPLPAQAGELRPPNVPDHEMLRRVGRGAYGEVWLARNAIDSFHAVKIVRKENFEQPEPFDREFRGLQKFMPISREHPGLVQILHVGRNDAEGFFYYVMPAADGEKGGQQIDPADYVPKNLAREIARRGHFPLTECLALGLDLAGALDFLHQQGLIHRDIKPANIIFVRGAPRLADIGLVTTIATPEQAVTYLGTKGYIPPEGPGTPAADVFSLGKVLYEACMGLPAESFPELPATMISRPEAASLFQLNQILLRACHEEPTERYATAAELRAGLLELQAQVQSVPNS